MMKTSKFLLLIILFSATACRQDTASAPLSDKGNFTYSTSGSRVLITMNIPIGSKNAKMIFDTGGLGLLLDSNSASELFNMKKLERKTKNLESSVFFPALSRDLYGKTYFQPVDIPFYGGVLHYDWFMICEGLKDEFEYDGIFSIPQNDLHTWNFDFENLSITIDDTDLCSGNHESDFSCKVDRCGEKLYMIDFPISFSGATDSISIKQRLLFDTGCSSALVFNCDEDELNEERRFIDNNALLRYKTHIDDNLSLIYSPGYVSDTLLVTLKQKNLNSASIPHIIGRNLLAKFNISIDLKNEKAYFKRNDVSNMWEYFNEHSSLERAALVLIPDKERKTAIVTSAGRESPAYKAGVRQYDVIEQFDGGTFVSYNSKYAMMRQRGEGDTFTFDIDRFGDKVHISFFWPFGEK